MRSLKEKMIYFVTLPSLYVEEEPLPMSRRQKIANIQTDCSETKESILIEGGEDQSP